MPAGDRRRHAGARHTTISPSSKRAFARDGDEIAGVIVEPVAGNMNLVAPDARVSRMRCATLCTRHGAVLIFDEVMTGFRVGPAARRRCTAITPDLTTLGKVIGGGMPVGAFGGRARHHGEDRAAGPGLSGRNVVGNPVAVAAGLATLKLVRAPGFYEELEQTHARADRRACSRGEQRRRRVFRAQSIGGMFGIYFRAQPPRSYAEVMQCDVDAFNRFFHAMLDARRLLRPVGVRSGLRVVRAWRSRHRKDGGCGTRLFRARCLIAHAAIKKGGWRRPLALMRARSSAQAGDVFRDRFDFPVGQFGRNRAHHAVRVVRALACAKALQLRGGIYGSTGRPRGKLGGNTGAVGPWHDEQAATPFAMMPPR